MAKRKRKQDYTSSNTTLTIVLIVAAAFLFAGGGTATGASITGNQFGWLDWFGAEQTPREDTFAPAPPTPPPTPIAPDYTQPAVPSDFGAPISEPVAPTPTYAVPTAPSAPTAASSDTTGVADTITSGVNSDYISALQTEALLENQIHMLAGKGSKIVGPWGCSCVCNAIGELGDSNHEYAWGRACVADCTGLGGGSGGGPGGGVSATCASHCKTLCGAATVAAAQCKKEC